MIVNTPSEHLTRRQRDVLKFIASSIEANGYAPSVRDVARHLDYKSTRSAARLVNALNDKGFIDITPGIARGIRVVSQFDEHGVIQ